MRFTQDFLDDLCDRISLSDVVGSRADWDRKKTRAAKGDFWACCPIHGENSPSFHVDDRKGFFHCFGCGASGNHFKFFMLADGVPFPRAVEMVADLAGVGLPGSKPESTTERAEREKRANRRSVELTKQEQERLAEERHRLETVRGIWSASSAITGTLAERYLIGRGISSMAWPASLRFHPGLTLNGREHPALICGVQSRTRTLVALWRIFLRDAGDALTGEDGRKVKLGLGPAGGAAVRLGPFGPEIDVCEGVETGFGVGCLTAWKRPVWPLLSTSGMIAWEPPEGVRRVGIYADGDKHKVNAKTLKISDPPGSVAALALKERLQSVGITATVHEPPAGSDWLDVWNTLRSDEGRVRDVEYLAG